MGKEDQREAMVFRRLFRSRRCAREVSRSGGRDSSGQRSQENGFHRMTCRHPASNMAAGQIVACCVSISGTRQRLFSYAQVPDGLLEFAFPARKDRGAWNGRFVSQVCNSYDSVPSTKKEHGAAVFQLLWCLFRSAVANSIPPRSDTRLIDHSLMSAFAFRFGFVGVEKEVGRHGFRRRHRRGTPGLSIFDWQHAVNSLPRPHYSPFQPRSSSFCPPAGGMVSGQSSRTKMNHTAPIPYKRPRTATPLNV